MLITGRSGSGKSTLALRLPRRRPRLRGRGLHGGHARRAHRWPTPSTRRQSSTRRRSERLPGLASSRADRCAPDGRGTRRCSILADRLVPSLPVDAVIVPEAHARTATGELDADRRRGGPPRARPELGPPASEPPRSWLRPRARSCCAACPAFRLDVGEDLDPAVAALGRLLGDVEAAMAERELVSVIVPSLQRRAAAWARPSTASSRRTTARSR